MKILKPKLIGLLFALVTVTAHADNQSYFAPSVIKDCHLDKVGAPVCTFDNTFLKVGYSSLKDFGGDYQFRDAIVRFPFYPNEDYSVIVYYYANQKGNLIALGNAYLAM